MQVNRNVSTYKWQYTDENISLNIYPSECFNYFPKSQKFFRRNYFGEIKRSTTNKSGLTANMR